MRAARVVLVLVLAAALSACLRRASYHCETSAQCDLAGGRCEPDGYCSVADGACATGYRYADGAPAAGTCVGELPDAGTASPDAPSAAEPVCLVQAKLAATPGTCAEKVCAVDARCCAREWGEGCVQLAETTCHAHCSGVVALSGPGKVAVLRWATSAYAPVWSTALGTAEGYSAVAWADYDRDGDPDLAVCDPMVGVRIYRNSGQGGGTCGAPFCKVDEVGPVPDCQRLRWIDLDGDGDLDLVGAGAYRGFAWFVDDGIWQTAVLDAFGMDITSGWAWADLDGDGDQDVALAHYGAPMSVETLAATGAQQLPTFTGVWSDATTFANVSYESTAWGDVDRDGTLDLMASGSNFLRVWTSTTAIGFAPATALYLDTSGAVDVNDARFVDADGDGDLDIVGAADGERTFALRNNVVGSGAHTYTATPIWIAAPTMNGTHLAVGDVDGDGFEDLLVAAAPTAGAPAGSALFLKRGAAPAWGDAADGPDWIDPEARVIHDVAFAPDWQ
ncbi:MAG: VCBS repeat-containing protein [Deltaproteobacteria bacterium]|nr:VCBS repeat-containing protein [Deltaproteobacteria bacterium]